MSSHNRDRSKTWKEAVNEFSPLSAVELRKTLGHGVANPRRDAAAATAALSTFKAPSPSAALGARRPPAAVDWREHGVITPVKNQGYCGSCWAFAATEQTESYWALAHGARQLTTLATQQIVSCADVYGAVPWSWLAPLNGSGCFGGFVKSGYEHVARFGLIVSEAAFPYVSGLPWKFPEGIAGSPQNGVCVGPFAPFPGPSARSYEIAGPAALLDEWAVTSLSFGAAIRGHAQVQRNSAEAVLAALHEIGPLAVVVDASRWHPYLSGVFDGCNNSALELNHAVQLVGYGRDAALKTEYWLVRNSWGPSWGEGGYIRLRRGGDESECTRCVDLRPWFSEAEGGECVDVCGNCGVLTDPNYPVVKNVPLPDFKPADAHRL